MTRSSSTEDQPAGWQGTLCLEAPASARWSWSIHAAHQPGPVPGRSRQSCVPAHPAGRRGCHGSKRAHREPAPTQRGARISAAARTLCSGHQHGQGSASPLQPARGAQEGPSSRLRHSQGAAPGTAPAALAEGAQKEPACPAVRLRLCSLLQTPSPAAGLPAQPQAGIAGMEAEHTTSLQTELAKLMGGTA